MTALRLRDFEGLARSSLDAAVYDFFAGGAGDELTLRDNEAAFELIRLVPRVLRGVKAVELGTSLLGLSLSSPVVVAPTAFHKLAHPDGEVATARACQAAGALFIASMASTVSIEDVRKAAPTVDIWFQLYVQPDRPFTEAVVRRAERAGCSAIVVSVDSPVLGLRERDLRNCFLDLPVGLECENMRDKSGKVRKIAFTPDLSWEAIDWLRSKTDLPIVLKGIAHPEDAVLATEHGVNALVVSNHGGRQLDSMPPAIALLPAIATAVGGAIPVLVDGGVRRGTDVIKAFALGASAVGIGRPVIWGLASAGQRGVEQVLTLFAEEVRRALALCGIARLSDVGASAVTTWSAR